MINVKNFMYTVAKDLFFEVWNFDYSLGSWKMDWDDCWKYLRESDLLKKDIKSINFYNNKVIIVMNVTKWKTSEKFTYDINKYKREEEESCMIDVFEDFEDDFED